MQRTWAEPPELTAPLAQLATRQHGVVDRRQLLDLGFSPQAISTLVARGALIRIHRAVYAVGHACLTVRSHWAAAVHACGDEAWLGHAAGLCLHGVWRPGGTIHVVASGRHRVPGVRIHTVRDPACLGATVVDGIPVTSLERAVLDVTPAISPQRLRGLLEEIERRDRFDLRRFEDCLSTANGHRGVGRLRDALAELGDDAPWLASELEARFLELIRGGGLPEPSANVLVLGERVDFVWPRQRVIVEIDSWRYHRSRRSFEGDRRRANAFALAGYVVLRVTDARVRDEPAAVTAEISAALRGGDVTLVG